MFLLIYGLHFTVREGGGLIRETKLPMHKLELKMQGGLCARGGGVIAGFYGITKLFAEQNFKLVKPSYLHITEKFSGIYPQCEKGHHMVCLAGRIANVVCA